MNDNRVLSSISLVSVLILISFLLSAYLTFLHHSLSSADGLLHICLSVLLFILLLVTVL